jgi:predicted nuclease of predicted toxin-antitoxin system
MTFWLDKQLLPFLAPWIAERFGVACHSVVDLPVDRGDDEDIFLKARQLSANIISKDSDFVDLVNRLGKPPQILWITCGNRSNALMRELLISSFPQAMSLLAAGEAVVELA